MARPRFSPTEENHRLVKTMAGLGVPQEQIAVVLDIAPQTLRRHFRRELERGAIEANAEVANSFFKMAKSGNHPAASIFWLKTRCGWRERAPQEQGEIVPPRFEIRIEEKDS